MLTEKQVEFLREELKTSRNPLFIYDDDADGLCSFLLLYRMHKEGKGLALKTSPKVDISMMRKVNEIAPDKIFILDVPIVEQEFIDAANRPIFWIDHHQPLSLSKVHYFNPRLNNPDAYIPTTQMAYQISANPDDLWIGAIGCLADWYIPDFIELFAEKYPLLLSKKSDLTTMVYKEPISVLIKAFFFLLKGQTSEVRKSVNILTRIKSPSEILQQETSPGKFLYRRFTSIDQHYQKLLLEAKKQDSADQVPVFISELRKEGWLNVQFNKDDARKKIYTLKDRFNLSVDIHAAGGKLNRSDIESILSKAADLIRTRVDYKFILILLFMKRVSDKWELDFDKAYKEALKDGLSEAEAKKEARSPAYHDFDLAEEHRWENMRKDVGALSSVFSKALKSLADRNPELKDILDSVDFVQFTSNRENTEILRQLVELFSEKRLHNVAPDILGDAYEWILRYFAPDKAKEGEIYTPRETIKLLNEILDPQPKESIYDCSCGSAGMLIGAYKHVEETMGLTQARKILLYGQEVNQKTIALAKLNMYVHDMRDCSLNYGDTLLYPKFKEGGKIIPSGIKVWFAPCENKDWEYTAKAMHNIYGLDILPDMPEMDLGTPNIIIKNADLLANSQIFSETELIKAASPVITNELVFEIARNGLLSAFGGFTGGSFMPPQSFTTQQSPECK